MADAEAVASLLSERNPEPMLVGCVVIAEWMEADGSRSMSVQHWPADAPEWTVEGWLGHAARHNLEVEAEEEEDA